MIATTKQTESPVETFARACEWIVANGCYGNVLSVSTGNDYRAPIVHFASVDSLRSAFAGTGERMKRRLGEDGLMYYSVEFVGIRFVAQERASSVAVVIGETVL